MTNFTETFNTPWTDNQHRIGETFKVLGEKDKNDYDFEEVGIMYMIEFSDGTVIDAFPEEIVVEYVNENKHTMLQKI